MIDLNAIKALFAHATAGNWVCRAGNVNFDPRKIFDIVALTERLQSELTAERAAERPAPASTGVTEMANAARAVWKSYYKIPQGVTWEPPSAALFMKLYQAMHAAARPAVDDTCHHDDLVRLGAIWTKCEQCGKRWADDEGAAPDERPQPWQARASLAQPVPAAQPDPWHQAVLNECMKIEGAYDSSDPAKTITTLIDWHVKQADEVHNTNKVLADNYLKLTCKAAQPEQQPVAKQEPLHHYGLSAEEVGNAACVRTGLLHRHEWHQSQYRLEGRQGCCIQGRRQYHARRTRNTGAHRICRPCTSSRTRAAARLETGAGGA